MKKLFFLPILLSSSFLIGSTPNQWIAVQPEGGVTKTPSQTSSTPNFKWTAKQLSESQKVCSRSALESNPKASQKQADRYCQCALSEAARRWTYADFAQNETKYTEQLGKEGVVNKCAKEALQR